MVAPVDIANIGLRALGRSPITTLTEASTEARACNFWYPIARKDTLARSDWTFARRRLALPPITNTWEARWEHAYDIPADCLRFIRVYPNNYDGVDAPRFPHQLMGGSVFTNIDEAYGEYVFDQTVSTTWSIPFAIAVGHNLAAMAAHELTRKASLRNDMFALFVSHLETAIIDDAAQEKTFYGTVATYAEARTRGPGAGAERSTGADGSNYWSS